MHESAVVQPRVSNVTYEAPTTYVLLCTRFQLNLKLKGQPNPGFLLQDNSWQVSMLTAHAYDAQVGIDLNAAVSHVDR